MANHFMVYGANGYTGTLIARLSSHYGLAPILAGRNKTAVEALANKLSLPFRVFTLEDKEQLIQALQDVAVVVHAAGPFNLTAAAMVEACLATNTHYLDINGDIAVFETIQSYHHQAINAGIMLLPGIGFDVVPTDCTAAYLKESMPDAVSLELAFATLGGHVSHGTATSMVLKLGLGGTERKNGELIQVPLGKHGKWLPFLLQDGTEKKRFVMSIPWGDISTAFWSTRIPNIVALTGMQPTVYRMLKVQTLFNPILRSKWLRRWLQKRIDNAPAGPSDEQRATAVALIYGKCTNAGGNFNISRMTVPEGYTLTAHGALLGVSNILRSLWKPGYQTPATAYGPDFVLEIPGAVRHPLTKNQTFTDNT